jgi:uncharacterized protein with GYD domain
MVLVLGSSGLKVQSGLTGSHQFPGPRSLIVRSFELPTDTLIGGVGPHPEMDPTKEQPTDEVPTPPQLPTIRQTSLPTQSELMNMKKRQTLDDQTVLLQLLNNPPTSSDGLRLTNDQVSLLQSLLEQIPLEPKRQARHASVSHISHSSHFDYHDSLRHARDAIKFVSASSTEKNKHQHIEDSTVDQIFAIFHNERQSQRTNTMAPLKRFQSAVRTVIRRNHAARVFSAFSIGSTAPSSTAPSTAPSGDGASTESKQEGGRKSSIKHSDDFKADYKHVQTRLETTFKTKGIYDMCEISNLELQKKLSLMFSTIDQWNDFDIFQVYTLLGNDILQTVKLTTMIIFEAEHSLLRQLKVKPFVVMRYVSAIASNYNNQVTYHTALHGIDVMQGLHSMLSERSTSGITEKPITLTDEVLYSALLAALVHDVGHGGVSNRFLQRTKSVTFMHTNVILICVQSHCSFCLFCCFFLTQCSYIFFSFHPFNFSDPLAIKYNDQSVLENMHVSVALSLLSQPGCDVLETFSAGQRRSTRSLWISMILETDMANHMSGLWSLERELLSASPNGEVRTTTYSAFSSKNYVNTLSLLLHACDLSNPSKPWDTYNRWTGLVMEEFFTQSATEQKLNIPITLPLRETCQLDQFQIGFIRFIRPFFVCLDDIPNISMDVQIENLNNNEETWVNSRREKEQKDYQ